MKLDNSIQISIQNINSSERETKNTTYKNNVRKQRHPTITSIQVTSWDSNNNVCTYTEQIMMETQKILLI